MNSNDIQHTNPLRARIIEENVRGQVQQDNLSSTVGNGVLIPADDTQAVHYNRSDNKTDAEKLQARTNIGLQNVDNTSDMDKPVSTALQLAISLVDTKVTQHISNLQNPHAVTKTLVGLGNVQNISPENMPISNATQSALDTKQPTLVSGTNIKTINNNTILGSGNLVLDNATWGNITGNILNQQDLQQKFNTKQDTLVSSVNIKTINELSILGSGDLQLDVGVKSVDGDTGDVITHAVKYIQQSLTDSELTLARANIKAGDIKAVDGIPGPAVLVDADTLGGHAPSYFATAEAAANSLKYTQQTLTSQQKAQSRANIDASNVSVSISGQSTDDISYITVNGVEKRIAGVGSTDINAVHYLPEEKTAEQKLIARTNIGAGTSDFSGDYNDLTNKPTIPTVNDAVLTILKNDATIDTFTANSDTDKIVNIDVPTKTSELTNDSGFITSQALQGYATESYVQSYHDASKQDVITNLETIEAGAALGATAVQPSALNSYSTTTQMNAAIAAYHDSTKQNVISDLTTIRTGATAGSTAVLPAAISDMATKTWVGDQGYITSSDVPVSSVNGKTGIVVLSASDVGALPSSTVIPTVNDGVLTIQKNSVTIDTFSANQASNKTINVSVPTKTSDLSNDSNFITAADIPVTSVNAKTGSVTLTLDDISNGTTYVRTTNDFSNTYKNQIDSNTSNIATNAGNISNNTTAIATINGKIPAQATSSNQLADKEFVNSSINNIAAYYITKNASGDEFATYAELQAATTFYSGGQVRVPTRNDYCIVHSDELHPDPAGSTNYPTTRYIYTLPQGSQTGQWEYQYTVNSTPFTAVQWAAVNSGATTSNIGLISTNQTAISTHVSNTNNPHNVTKAQVGLSNVANVLQYSASNEPPYPVTSVNSKTGAVALTYSDVGALPGSTVIPSKTSDLTNDSGFITSSGAPVQSVAGKTGTVTLSKSDVGLSNVGNFKAVSTVASQGLSSQEQTNARNNIGAGTSSFSGSYTDLSNKPVIPSISIKTFSIGSSWTLSASGDYYTQTITIQGSAANWELDVLPDVNMLVDMVNDGCIALLIDNDNGVLTLICLGEHLTSTYASVLVCVTEVTTS